MSEASYSIGIVGGNGMLGSAIASALLKQGAVPPDRLWISSRSGTVPDAIADAGVRTTRSNQDLADACDLVLLSVPPAQCDGMTVDAADRLVVSVMAGVSIERLKGLTGARRVVRAMSSPAAALSLAYSPWVATPEVDTRDREQVRRMFEACGLTDEVTDEGQIECFTAMTGPVPGFVAFFADCMAKYARDHGVAAPVADRAVRQLFLSAGRMLAEGPMTPADHVRQMIDYAGTTAAGLNAMLEASIVEDIAKGLDASVARTREIGR
ncbi:MAG: NAD(P)-binding domain-containing protein [Rhodobiaceae bacterium]|nr:NAD(P)-binding domain-containing protein [Rhodobiaceae bacterium]